MQVNNTDALLSAHPYTCFLEEISPILKHIHVGAGAHTDIPFPSLSPSKRSTDPLRVLPGLTRAGPRTAWDTISG